MLVRALMFRSSAGRFRRAVVTGASSGIGAAFARALPQADLLLTGRDAVALEALAADLRVTGHREIRVVTADLTQTDERAELIDAARAFEPDLLINDAGTGAYGPFLEAPTQAAEQTVLVNVLAPVVLTHSLLPEMLARAEAAGGRCGLVNVASTLAFCPFPNAAAYAASKAFVLSLTEALASELGRRPVDVLAVCPGAVRTAFFRRSGSPGLPPGAISPERVARRALDDLGRYSVCFTDRANNLLLRPVADARAVLSWSVSAALGVLGTVSPRSRTGQA
jgi:short-subunit dehydrogenase